MRARVKPDPTSRRTGLLLCKPGSLLTQTEKRGGTSLDIKGIMADSYEYRNLIAIMQTLTEKILRLNPPGGLFDSAVVINLFPEATQGARKLLVNRALSYGEILRIRPGAYCLSPDHQRTHPHPFVVAALLLSPSHVSLESALSYHGLIPEAVFQVASATAHRSRIFTTPLGRFEFHRVPCNEPRAGVHAEKLADDSWAFVASPLRTIADLVYLRKSVSWNRDGLRFLTDSMRIDESDLHNLSFAGFDDIMRSFRDHRTRDYLVGMRKELRR